MKRKTFLDWLKANGCFSSVFRLGICEAAKRVDDIEVNIFCPYNSKNVFMFVKECGGKRQPKKYKVNKKYVEEEIQNILEEIYDIDVYFCDHCGCLITEGFMQEGGWWYSCNGCFREAMNNKFGEGEWRSNLNADDDEPYYEYLDNNQEWLDAEIFWTTWN